MLIKRNKSKTSLWIPIGYSPVNYSIISMRQPMINGKTISNTMAIVGMSGTGKSVISRTMMYGISLNRPIWVFDCTGRDHYLGYYKNSSPTNLAPFQRPCAIHGYYFHYAVKGKRAKLKHEIAVKPNFSKYNIKQLESVGFTGAGTKNIKNVMEKYGGFKDMETFTEFIDKFPTSAPESKSKAGHNITGHHKPYRVGDYIKGDSLGAMKRDLEVFVKEKEIYRMDSKHDINMNILIKSGKNAIFSFNDFDLARAEIDYMFNQLEQYVDKHPSAPRPFIFIEEAHLILAKKSDELSKMVRYIVLVCRKLGIGLCLILPTLIGLDEGVFSDIKDWVIGKLKGKSASMIRVFVKNQAVDGVSYLKFNRYENIREFIYYNMDYGVGFKFIPFECPQEYVRVI